MKTTLLTAALASIAYAEQEFRTEKSCLALALNGGGSKGAYQAGVIWGWTHYGNPEDFQWDVVTGISGGAINTGAMSMWAPDQALEMSEWISDQWVNLHTKDIYKEWPGGLVWGLLEKASIFDNTPMYDFLTGIFNTFPDGAKRASIVGTVDANNAAYLRWNGAEADVASWPAKVVSSASLPGLFSPALIDDHVCIDGGTAMGLDSTSAVEECLKYVDDESQVTLDVILLDRFTLPDTEESSKNTVENIMREHSVKSYYHGLENVIQTQVAHPNVNYRYLIQPSGAYPKLWNLLNFENSNTWPMQEEGRSDAKTCLETGKCGPFSMQELKDWAENKEGINGKYGGNLRSYIDSFFD